LLIPGRLQAAANRTISVVGWPLPDLASAAPSLAVGDDPVLGRQTCPPLTRLNLDEHHSEELLLRRAVTEFSNTAHGSEWRFELRTGIYWWDGKPVTTADVATYLREVLPEIVKERGAGFWSLPPHEVQAEGSRFVVVRWQKAPPFGPFVLNDAPFYRRLGKSGKVKNQGIGFECAGLYRMRLEDFGLLLTPTPGYHFKVPLPTLKLYREGIRPRPGSSERVVEFRYANSFSGNPARRGPLDPAVCAHPIELPYATMIIWNPARGPTANKDFRRLLTQLVPRRALATAGAAFLADVATGPIPQSHPGYDPKAVQPKFNIQAASAGLLRLGYRRRTADAPRVDARGVPLKLVLLTQPSSPGLTEKVISDAYSAVGINIVFKTQLARGEVPDGVLASFALDWPRVNFLGNFHSGAAHPSPFWPLDDKGLDSELENYAVSLTQEKPDFSLLGAVQRHLNSLQPITVLLQQKACMESGPLKIAKGGLNLKNPDWFRELLL